MNKAMMLLAKLGGYQEEQSTEAGTSTQGGDNPAVFSPNTVVTQTTAPGMREAAEAQQAAEAETGSIGGDPNPENPSTTPTVETQADDSQATSTEETQAAEGVYEYGGLQVTITNKPEMVDAFKEKGLDIDVVNKELYSKDGLTQETRDKLNEAFGQQSVDMYLEGWQKSNDAYVSDHNGKATELDNQVNDIITEVAGDKLTDVLSWANDNLSAEDYKNYQDKINGDDLFTMKLALQDLTSRAGVSNPLGSSPAVAPSARATAITSENLKKDATSEMLSASQYQALFTPDAKGKSKYWENPSKYDQQRNAGKEAGI